MGDQIPVQQNDELKSLKDYTLMVYVLQAGIIFFLISFVVAVVLNYIRKEDVANTWLASHFRWQLRTFWFTMLWTTLTVLSYFIGIGFLLGPLAFFAITVWLIYRIAKGLIYLSEYKPMYLMP